MSTRATYGFRGEFLNTVFYIHFDGYPEGAAKYFANAKDCWHDINRAADVFFRSNELAQHTLDHECHGDTEYRYQIDEIGGFIHPTLVLTASKRINLDSNDFTIFFTGSVDDFIKKYPPVE